MIFVKAHWFITTFFELLAEYQHEQELNDLVKRLNGQEV